MYKNKIEPTRDVVSFFAYVSFFPQLVAGPIERATNLLPQFYKKRTFDYAQAVDGLRQILWGLFKKVVVADGCATYANQIFGGYQDASGATLLLGAVLFTFQIYGDFSGYSDIAIGTARLFGFNLMRNFNFPYFSRDIAEFWRRWHISLTTWFRDYIYIPLGGSRGGKWLSLRNTMVIFLVSGLWHGANWTFIAWGAYHALLFVPLLLLGKNRKNTTGVASFSVKDLLSICCTFALVVLGWIIFRADTIDQAMEYIWKMCSMSLFSIPDLLSKKVLLTIAILLAVEWIGRNNQFALAQMPRKAIARYAIYLALVGLILWAGNWGHNQFIYFQF